MSEVPAHSAVVLAAAKSSRKKDQETSLPGQTAKKKKTRSLAQILSLNQVTVSMVDRDLAESRLAISSIINSTGLPLVKTQHKHQEPNAKKPKKRLSPVKSQR